MKPQSADLLAHRQQGTTTLAWCWKVTRKDGQVFGFTSTDTSLTIAGVIYPALTGIQPSAAQGAADLSVRNMEIHGTLIGEVITEADVLAGLWDNAAVEVFEVNYLGLPMGDMPISSGSTGDIKTNTTQYNAETRGISQALQQPIGDTVTPGCTAVLGDAKCGVDVEALRQTFYVGEVTSAREFVAVGITGPDDTFGAGEVSWDTGDNAGYRMEVNSSVALTSNVVLSLPMIRPIQLGDTGTIIPGCRKRWDLDCRDRYDNIVRFRGYPHVPGNNRVFGAGGLVGGAGMSGADLIADARSYLGVPWKHQGRTRRGLDCAGLVRQVAFERGLTEFDTRNYSAQASDETMLALCSEHMDRISLRDMSAGDVVVMNFSNQRHMGFIGDYVHGGLSLVHACALYPRKVVEVRLDEVWRARIMAAFRFPGLN